MRICRPSLVEMKAFTNRCLEPRPRRRRGPLGVPAQTELFAVSNKYGLTIGNLFDVAERLTKEHRSCPNADLAMHDPDDGHVKVRVHFQATIKFDPKDARLHRSREVDEQEEVSKQERITERTRMIAFLVAKQTGEHFKAFLRTKVPITSSRQHRTTDPDAERIREQERGG